MVAFAFGQSIYTFYYTSVRVRLKIIPVNHVYLQTVCDSLFFTAVVSNSIRFLGVNLIAEPKPLRNLDASTGPIQQLVFV